MNKGSQNLLRNFLLSLPLVFACGTVLAEDFLGGAKSNSLTTAAGSAEFVPVEQAYSVRVVVEAERLLFNWTIRDGYYLYRDRFKFNSLDDGTVLN